MKKQNYETQKIGWMESTPDKGGGEQNLPAQGLTPQTTKGRRGAQTLDKRGAQSVTAQKAKKERGGARNVTIGSIGSTTKGLVRQTSKWRVASLCILFLCLIAAAILGANVLFAPQNKIELVAANDKAVADWQTAVSESVAGSGAQRTVTLDADWGGVSGNYTMGFAPNGVGYNYGALFVPTGADIVLDLNGHTLSRNLTGYRSHGYVIYVSGKLTVRDSSGTALGLIMGGYSSTGSEAGGVYIAGGGTFNFEGGTISNNFASNANGAGGVFVAGGGTFNMGAGAIISGNSGTSSSSSTGGVANYGTANITGGSISGNTGYVFGAFVDYDSASSTLTNVTISGNTTTSGNAGVTHYSSKPFTMRGCTVQNNRNANQNAGAAGLGLTNSAESLIEDCTFDTGYAAGSGLYANNSKVTLRGCTFSGGEGIYAITSNNSANVILENCNILNNNSPNTNWSPVYAQTANSVITMKNCLVSGNTGSSNYGVIMVEGTLNLEDTEIKNNVGSAAVRLTSTAKMSIKGKNIIYDNKVSADSGAAQSNVLFTTGSTKMEVLSTLPTGSKIGITRNFNGAFTKNYGKYNTAEPSNYFVTDSATVSAISSEEVTYEGEGGVSEKVLEASTASFDSRVNWEYAVLTSLANNGETYTATMYSNWTGANSTSGFGTLANCYANGGLNVPAGASVILELNGHTVNRGLTSRQDYGYVIQVMGQLTIQDSSAEKTGTLTGGYNRYTDYSSGVHVANGGYVLFKSGNISGNNSYTGSSSSSSYRGGGAGVQVVSGGTFLMEGGKISNNTASTHVNYALGAGGVKVSSGGTFTMTGGEITGNMGAWGAICNYGTTRITGSETNKIAISNNQVTRYDAVFTGSGTLTMTDCVLSGNNYSNATEGALISVGGTSTAELERLDCTANTIGTSGVFVAGTSNATVKNCTFTGNTGSKTDRGNIVNMQDSGTLTMQNCTISGNTTVCVPIYIRTATATFTLTDSTISNNTGTHMGVMSSYGITEIDHCIISGNTSTSNSPGMHNGGTLTITDTEIFNNKGGTTSAGVGVLSTGDDGSAVEAVSTLNNVKAHDNESACGGFWTNTNTNANTRTVLNSCDIYNNKSTNASYAILEGYSTGHYILALYFKRHQSAQQHRGVRRAPCGKRQNRGWRHNRYIR